MARYKREQRASHSGGKKEIVISEETRKQIRALAGYGLRLPEISDFLDISVRTLQRRCAKELKTGHLIANSQVAQSLFQQAVGKDGVKRNVVAGIFWMKTRAGWKETQKIEHGLAAEDLQQAVGAIVEAIRGSLPRRCPGCRTALKLGPELAQQLLALSERLENKKEEDHPAAA
ncbi:MAG: hypothetical protein V3T64_09220 [Myxococcota bacterium]